MAKAKLYSGRALTDARQKRAKSLELRAANEHGAALARAGQTAASSRTARSGLRLVPEGFDTLDLKEAKALLDELAA
jgi:hypothetical protein